MAGENENTSENVLLDKISLESILAEYKGSAYINGDKRTPPELLQEQAEKILKEATGVTGADLPSSPDGDVGDVHSGTKKERTGVKKDASERAPTGGDAKQAVPAAPPEASKPADSATPQKAEETDNVILFFDNYRSPEAEAQESLMKDVEKAIKKEIRRSEAKGETNKDSGMFIYSGEGEDEVTGEDEEFEEPDLKDAAYRFTDALGSISLRCIPAALTTLLMVILTFSFEAGLVLPFGIGRSQAVATGTLMLALLIVMLLCIDIIVRGALLLARGTPNAETLILFSCVFSVISALVAMFADATGVLPFCAVSAFSLTFAAFGERYSLRAITETLKTASGSMEPYGVQAEYNAEINKSVLKKAYNRTDGFYNNLMHPDIVETAYRYATPVLLAAALILSIFAMLRGHAGYSMHIISALFAAAAPFSVMLSFSLPFGMIARSIRKSGAALAGWGGADDVCFTDGACVTDEDLFPPGTLSLSGLKLFDGASPEMAIRYTASLIIASGSGLSNVFSEVLKSQGMSRIRVEDFSCYEGGIGALIRGERVATGSAGFMNLLGFRIPDDVNIKNAVFTAVNEKLVAMFAVDYTPINSVQGALISILKWRVKLYLAVRDFNVTPLMLEQKFRVSLEDIEFIQARDSYSISDSHSGREGRMAAVLTREGFGPFAEAVTGGRLLKSVAFVATVVSIISAALGIIIMFYMCWSGAFMSARPGNLMLFMLSMLAAVLVVCGYVRFRK